MGTLPFALVILCLAVGHTSAQCNCIGCSNYLSYYSDQILSNSGSPCPMGTTAGARVRIKSRDTSTVRITTSYDSTFTTYVPAASSAASVTCFDSGSTIYVAGSGTILYFKFHCNNYISNCPVDYDISMQCISSGSSYNWATGAWGTCSVACGGGVQTRSVTCQNEQGAVVADSNCPGSKPATSQSCNTASCSSVTFSWSTGAWGPCSVACGGGSQGRQVACVSSAGSTVDDTNCPGGAKPIQSQSCNIGACSTTPFLVGVRVFTGTRSCGEDRPASSQTVCSCACCVGAFCNAEAVGEAGTCVSGATDCEAACRITYPGSCPASGSSGVLASLCASTPAVSHTVIGAKNGVCTQASSYPPAKVTCTSNSGASDWVLNVYDQNDASCSGAVVASATGIGSSACKTDEVSHGSVKVDCSGAIVPPTPNGAGRVSIITGMIVTVLAIIAID